MTQHRVLLFQSLAALGHVFGANAQLLSQSIALCALVRQEFVKRRVEQAYCDRQALHRAEYALKVLALVGQELCESLFALLCILSQNHLAHRVNSISLKEHVLGAAKAYALSAKFDSHLRLRGAIGVGAYAKLAVLVGPLHDGVKELVCVTLFGLHLAV